MLLEDLKRKFDALKEELKFKASYEEVNDFCFIEDYIFGARFVSEKFSRQLINRMVESLYAWVGIMHSWLMPSPQDMIFMSEANKLDEEDKKEVTEMISKVMYFVRKNKRIGFERNRIDEGKFIDELVSFEKKDFSKFMIKFHKKFEDAWKESAK